MSSNSSKKNKSSGLRILWIPGRKSQPKGRFSTTNKHVSYTSAQKKSEVWSLGGSKAQNELLDLPLSETNGASTSSLALLDGMSSTLVKSAKGENLHRDNLTTDDSKALSECATMPTTPVAAISPNLNSPLSELAPSTPATAVMSSPIVITTVDILDLHNTLHPNDLPKVPSMGETDFSTSAIVLNSSAGTTASIITNSSPLGSRKAHILSAANNNGSPHKSGHRNHNNNQDDINSIKSISSYNNMPSSTSLEWIDKAVQERECGELMHKNKRKKAKKTLGSNESDQLDGCKIKDKHGGKSMEPYDDNDEKVVKCLYYSLMCCDCTIS